MVLTCSAPAQHLLQAQALPADTLTQRSLAPLVAALPGSVVSLNDLVRIALQENFTGRIALATRRAAEGSAIGEGRAIDPQLSLGSGFERGAAGVGNSATANAAVVAPLASGGSVAAGYTRGQGTGLLAAAGLGAQSAFTLDVSQPLLDGFNQRTAEWRARKLESSAAGYAYSRTRQQIAAEIELLYWNLAEAQASEAVYQRSLDLSQLFLTRNSQLAARDLVAEVDVLTTRSGVALRRAALTQARQARRDASDRLLFAAYGDRVTQQLRSDSLPAKTTDSGPDSLRLIASNIREAELVRDAVAARTDLLAARDNRDAAQVRSVRANNGVRPSLNVDGGFASYRGNSANVLSGSTTDNRWRLGLSISAPAFNRGDRGTALAQLALLDAEELQLRAAENAVLLEIREGIRAVQFAADRLAAAEEAASLSWDQLTAERKRLELGLGDSFRLLQTEELAVQSQLEAVRAQYDLARAGVRLRLARGEGP